MAKRKRSVASKFHTGGKRVSRPSGRPAMPKGGKPGQYQWSSAQGRWINLGKRK